MLTFKTWNTVYTLQDMGDGAFLISGHSRYCPTPQLVTLSGEVEVGQRIRFTYVNTPPVPEEGKTVTTTPVAKVYK